MMVLKRNQLEHFVKKQNNEKMTRRIAEELLGGPQLEHVGLAVSIMAALHGAAGTISAELSEATSWSMFPQ